MIELRPYEKCDAEKILSWIKSEKSFYQWSVGRFGKFPVRAEDINAYYESYSLGDDHFEFVACVEDEMIGHLIMRFLDAEKKSLRFGFIIVDGEKRGKGYGKSMLEMAIIYAFCCLKAEIISLGVFTNNISAHECYKSVGFKDTSVRNYYEFLGGSWECVDMEIVK